MDITTKNYAPDADMLEIEIKSGKHAATIEVSKEENGRVWVTIELEEGTRHCMILGEPGETTKL